MTSFAAMTASSNSAVIASIGVRAWADTGSGRGKAANRAVGGHSIRSNIQPIASQAIARASAAGATSNHVNVGTMDRV